MEDYENDEEEKFEKKNKWWKEEVLEGERDRKESVKKKVGDDANLEEKRWKKCMSENN